MFIVLVVYSMGGFVVKKVYFLVRRDLIYVDIVGRIYSFYFLGIFYRGVDFSFFVLIFIVMLFGFGFKVFVKEFILGLGIL